jgi:hypothetical protein
MPVIFEALADMDWVTDFQQKLIVVPWNESELDSMCWIHLSNVHRLCRCGWFSLLLLITAFPTQCGTATGTRDSRTALVGVIERTLMSP